MMSRYICILTGILLGSSALGSPQPKVTICHFNQSAGNWTAITIGAPAVDAHLRNHDDAVLEAGVGGTTSQTGTLLDANCVPI